MQRRISQDGAVPRVDVHVAAPQSSSAPPNAVGHQNGLHHKINRVLWRKSKNRTAPCPQEQKICSRCNCVARRCVYLWHQRFELLPSRRMGNVFLWISWCRHHSNVLGPFLPSHFPHLESPRFSSAPVSFVKTSVARTSCENSFSVSHTKFKNLCSLVCHGANAANCDRSYRSGGPVPLSRLLPQPCQSMCSSLFRRHMSPARRCVATGQSAHHRRVPSTTVPVVGKATWARTPSAML